MNAAEFNATAGARTRQADLAGQTFGRLTVVERAGRTERGHVTWTCLCSCGATTTVTTRNLHGTTTSCGCYRREQARKQNLIHGQAETLLYRRYYAMVNRVTNPNSEKYGLYGGRGITITTRWLEPNGCGFMNFRADMGEGFREDLTLDRIDVDGPYTPENCRWATAKQQARNTRRNRYLTLWGDTKSLAEWCELLDLNYDRTKRRLQRGWSVERSLTNDAGQAATWDKLFPVGTLVFAYPGARPEDIPSAPRLVTRTRTVAQMSASGDPVVWVDGEGSYICLTHVDPVSESVWQAAREAEQAVAVAAAPTEPSGDDTTLRAAFVKALSEAARTHPCPISGPYWTSCVHYDEAGRIRTGSCHSERRADAVLMVRDAEVERLTAELAEFASRVNELESRICECEPVREHRDLRRPAFYQHAADCPVNAGVAS